MKFESWPRLANISGASVFQYFSWTNQFNQVAEDLLKFGRGNCSFDFLRSRQRCWSILSSLGRYNYLQDSPKILRRSPTTIYNNSTELAQDSQMDRRVELYAYVCLCPSCLTSQVQGTPSGQGSTATLADSTAATHGCWPQVPTKPTCRAWLPAKALQVPVFLFCVFDGFLVCPICPLYFGYFWVGFQVKSLMTWDGWGCGLEPRFFPS